MAEIADDIDHTVETLDAFTPGDVGVIVNEWGVWHTRCGGRERSRTGKHRAGRVLGGRRLRRTVEDTQVLFGNNAVHECSMPGNAEMFEPSSGEIETTVEDSFVIDASAGSITAVTASDLIGGTDSTRRMGGRELDVPGTAGRSKARNDSYIYPSIDSGERGIAIPDDPVLTSVAIKRCIRSQNRPADNWNHRTDSVSYPDRG